MSLSPLRMALAVLALASISCGAFDHAFGVDAYKHQNTDDAGADEDAQLDPDEFEPSWNSVPIGQTDLYLPGGEKATPPSASTSDTAPMITRVTAVKTGPQSFSLFLDVENASSLAYVYLDFGDAGVYRVKPTLASPTASTTTDTPLTACGVAAQNQGIVCTSACLSACSCLKCPSASEETNAEQACALNCTLYDRQGLLAQSPYYGSEAKFASFVYNGNPELGLPGLISQTSCSASACVSAPSLEPAKTSKAWEVHFETPTVPELTPLVAPQVVTDDTPIASPPMAPASVAMCGSRVFDECPYGH